MTRDTVPIPTPASRATSMMVGIYRSRASWPAPSDPAGCVQYPGNKRAQSLRPALLEPVEVLPVEWKHFQRWWGPRRWRTLQGGLTAMKVKLVAVLLVLAGCVLIAVALAGGPALAVSGFLDQSSDASHAWDQRVRDNTRQLMDQGREVFR